MKKIITATLIVVFSLFLVAPALATVPITSTTPSGGGSQKVKSNQTLPNPLKTTDVNVLIGNIINFVLGFVGTISLLLFIYGGFTWMLSGGSAEKVKKGKDIIVWAVIGLFVVFMAYMMVRFVIQGVTGAI